MDYDFDFLDEIFDGCLSDVMDCYQDDSDMVSTGEIVG